MTGITALLLFAAWTLVLMLISRAYRMSLMMTMKKPVNAWTRGDRNEDPGLFVRAEHAHLNALENLPVFASIVVVAQALGQSATVVDPLALYFILARIAQSVTHLIGTSQPLVMIRATFFFIQVVLMVLMIVNLLT